MLNAALARVGVRPDAIAGHSVGEWTGMIAAGMLGPATVDGFIDSLRPGSLGTADLLFAAVGCGAEIAGQAVDGLADTVVSHDNCPHQAIICGPEEGVHAAVARLRKRKVLCQVLPFKSGFHTPLYAEHLELHRKHLAGLPLAPAHVPLWSATTCAPYPDDADQIRALFIDHLLKPVRFRELVDAMYADGVRAFVLMGPSGVGGFIDDTLRGRPHLSVAANSAKRSGLAQLARTVAALWVDGADVELDALPIDRIGGSDRREGVALALGAPLIRLDTPVAVPVAAAAPAAIGAPDALPSVGPSRVLAELEANFSAMRDAQRQVVEALALAPQRPARPSAPVAAAPRDKTWRRTISISTDPELVDHCFYRQAAQSTNLAERFPVVPMTMNLDLMIEAATRLVPERTAIGLENVTAYRWLAVAPPVDIEIKSRFDGVDRVQVRIGDFATGTVVLGERYPEAPAPTQRALTDERACPISADRLYEDRWMFRGPAYRGVIELGPMAADGIRGRLVSGAARGALLDNAGQLMGFWVMRTTELNRLAFPVRIQRIELFGPHPAPGDELDCTVWIPAIDESLVHSDMELVADGRVWARISDWVDKRFDTDEVLWPVLRYPEHNRVSALHEQAYFLCTDHTRSAASRELVARRYLTEQEFERSMEMGARRRRGWLLGRMAIRDAVRDWLWRRGHGPLFPIEIEVGNDDHGRPFVRGPFTDDLRVSVAHKEDVAVARVALGRDVGIDVERVEPRGEGFASIAFTPAERALRGGDDADEWLTRVWAAKEALAKALGTGLEGNPRRFEVKEAAGERLLVGMTDRTDPMEPVWVETRRDGDCVVAWTCD